MMRVGGRGAERKEENGAKDFKNLPTVELAPVVFTPNA